MVPVTTKQIRSQWIQPNQAGFNRLRSTNLAVTFPYSGIYPYKDIFLASCTVYKYAAWVKMLSDHTFYLRDLDSDIPKSPSRHG